MSWSLLLHMQLQLFEQFYHANYSRLLSLATRLLCDEEEARDVVSDAFEYGWSHFDKESEQVLSSHLYTLVRCRCIDLLRHRQVHETYVEFMLAINSEEEAMTHLERERRIQEVQRIMGLLTERTRKIFSECYINHKHYADVAEQMGISIVAVKKAVMQALATFRKEFSQY